jgi:hypothetical protein
MFSISKEATTVIQTTLMTVICALLLWFGSMFVELKLQASRIESDTVYMRQNQNEIKVDMKDLNQRLRKLEVMNYAKREKLQERVR